NLVVVGGVDDRYAGQNYFNATGSGTTTLTTLNSSSFQRQAGALMTFRGPNLGGTTGNSPVQVLFDSAPTLVGSGASGTPAVGVMPGVLSDNVIASGGFVGNISTAAGLGSGFATYDATVGVRPLTASEYSSTITNAGDHVSISSPPSVGDSTVNAPRLNAAGPGGAVPSGRPINVTR